MKDNRFEQMWREALENASENPPLHVWKHIDRKIAQENDFDNIVASKFLLASEEVPSNIWNAIDAALENDVSIEKQFESVFESSSINPPSDVWENIETILEKEDERKPVIFFLQNKWISRGIAAMLIALLSFPLLTNWIEKTNKGNLGQNTNAQIEKNRTSIDENNTSSIDKSSELDLSIVTKPNENIEPIINNSTFVASNGGQKKQTASSNEQVNNLAKEPKNAVVGNVEDIVNVIKNIWNAASLESLEKKSYSLYGTSLTLKRAKLPIPLSEDEEEYKKEKSKSWLGFMSGLAPFDPNISITNFERQALVSAGNVPNSFFEFKNVIESTGSANASNVFEIPLSQPFNDIRTGSAINLGIDYGFKMAKNFSFQTGVRYLRSSSFIESNVYSYNPSTGDVSTFLESHYFAKRTPSRSNTLISSSADVKNAYQFLMIPLQLGYHIPLFSKVDISGSAGISGDFMMNNILDDTPEGGSKLTPGNSAYKAVNLSGIGGLRVNYQVNENWDASIGANYQQALRSGVENTQNFSFRPKFFGVNYGINYKLN